MKVLVINWSWYPSGGDWTYIENLSKLYHANDVEIIPFSTHNSRNFVTNYNQYFVNGQDFKTLNKNKNFKNGLKVIKTSIVSHEAISKLEQLLNEVKGITVAHLHNVHHYITPAIIDILKAKGIKIVWTLHDFKIICPENSFLSNGKICEKCITGSFIHCFTNKCKKKSYLASALASIDAYYYHHKKIYDKVDAFLCPSSFLQKKFIQFGFNPSKLILAHSCYDIQLIDDYITNHKITSPVKEKFVLYIGRLEQIKGIHTLIEAAVGTNIKVKIVGTGNLEAALKLMAAGVNNIEFLGFKNKDEVFELTQQCEFVVCPSVCYENLPFSIIESFLFSKPVIGAEIGGIPELVLNEKTGLLFEPNNAEHLCEKMNYLWHNPTIVQQLGTNAREHAYNMVNYNTHWNKIQSVFNQI